MQLQQISPDHRPVPVIDVYPSSLMAGNVIAPWFSKRVPRLFGINSELGLHDTILVRSEDYDSGYFGLDSDGDDEVLGQRQLLAVLSPMRRGGQFEMALDDGSVWTMTALPTGSFDFNCIDEHGFKSTARWVRRSAAKSSAAGIDSADSTTISDCKFIFSMIDTHSRRHPILATLTRSTLEILDSYTTISSSASKYPPSRACTQPPTIRDRSASDDKISTYDEDVGRPTVTNAIQPTNMKTQTTLPVEAALKKFISISAILVSMHRGFSRVSGDYNFMTLPKFQPPPPSSEVAPMTVATPPEISPESSLNLQTGDDNRFSQHPLVRKIRTLEPPVMDCPVFTAK
ncbi:hypothetical protein SEPCBS119000_000039 [Sporothrix epigloea]|uniref:Uncharacterized protein n=1 Tax=Sporothrix epigloea TaxID=1892477 RepID=A0ABP0D2Z6_9PEZI